MTKELEMTKEILRIRTQDSLITLINSHATGQWRLDRERVANCDRIEIYNWDRTQYIHGEIDRSRLFVSHLYPDRLIIGFNPKTEEPINCRTTIAWEQQACAIYLPVNS